MITHHSNLGDVLRTLKEQTGLTLDQLSVLAPKNDPFRQDTPAGHRDGKWFSEQMARVSKPTIHLRGFHYILVTRRVRKPDGKLYKNDDDDWEWLQNEASKAARWLGYVPFDRIVDERNAPPHEHADAAAQRWEPQPYVSLYNAPEIPALRARDLRPSPRLGTVQVPQAYRLAFFGEKVSLETVLGSLAVEFNADLYLAAGEQTDTRLHNLAKEADLDGRVLVVFVFADCDPSGWQMVVSIAHKLRAFKESLYPDLEFRVHAPALTVGQVKGLDLPSTPLKESEKRASKWREAFGIEQTEIDALASLAPDTLEEIVRQAVAPYFDQTLAARIREARTDWQRRAQAKVSAAAKAKPSYAKLHDRAVVDLTKAKASLAKLEHATEQLVDRRDLPRFGMPEAEPDEDGPEPLVSSDMDLDEHIERLRERKRYKGEPRVRVCTLRDRTEQLIAEYGAKRTGKKSKGRRRK